MSKESWVARYGQLGSPQILRADGELVLCRTSRKNAAGNSEPVLAVLPVTAQLATGSLERLRHEYDLKDLLDNSWAARPREFVLEPPMLVLEDPGGEPLEHLIGLPIAIGQFLQLAIALTSAIGRLHERGLVHRDVKPANALMDVATSQIWLTGFGVAIRTTQDAKPSELPELIPGTLAYMAPEQTGRMSRSVDSRSDLYSLGVSLYQLLTGALPFTASDPIGWIHCHIARNPTPPERLTQVPSTLSAIILKLLAKAPEERYQTAFGLEWDLRRCLNDLNTLGQVGEFALGERDAIDRLRIPDRLYGRAHELDNLLASCERVKKTGIPELILLVGPSGIGKTAAVTELSRVVLTRGYLFGSGKFDEYTRNVPYATLAQAFKSLVRPLLGGSEAQLKVWNDALLKALGPNAALIFELVPELKLVLRELPAVSEPSIPDAQRRFHVLLKRLIGVFARPGQPLVLFLDDLQWLDSATLDFLEYLLAGESDARHLLVIGAYRANEIGPSHPLSGTLEAIRKGGSTMREIVLGLLGEEHLQQLIADSLHSTPTQVSPLSRMVCTKTGGNPFFAIQFLTTLVDERAVVFDKRVASWSWDIGRIQQKGYTDNVVDFMLSKLRRLPSETQTALQQLACIGSSAELSLLVAIANCSPQILGDRLQIAVQTGLLVGSDSSYKFVHDSAREAAYSAMLEAPRAATHLRIGTLLASQCSTTEREERIFEIVHHFSDALQLITGEGQRIHVMELSLLAARRAKNSAAYASALKYLATARLLLRDADWGKQHELVFSCEYLTAECELMTGKTEAAEQRLAALSEHANTSHESALVTRLRLTVYTVMDRSDLGVDICLQYLRRQGTEWSPHPTLYEVRHEYERIWRLLADRRIEDLLDLPVMTDPDTLETLEVLTEIVTPAVFFDQNLCSLVICRMLNLSLARGNSDGSCFAYVWFGIVAGPNFGNYEDAYRFGRLGYDLVEQRGLTRYAARTYMSFGNLVMPRLKHVREGRDLVRRAFNVAYQAGDFTFAAYSLEQIVTNLLVAGDRLSVVQAEAENGLTFARQTHFGIVIDLIVSQFQLIRSLRGLTPTLGSFDDGAFSEAEFERHLASNPGLADAEFGYWALKTQALYLAGDYCSAVRSSARAEPHVWAVPAMLELSGYRFYSALANAAYWDAAESDSKQRHYECVKALHRELEVLAASCPLNFKDRAALIGGEIARMEGRALDAEQLYEQATQAARASGFVHNEGIASEVAGRFYLSRGLETNAYSHLRSAAACFGAWGADAKVRQLESLYPGIASLDPHPATAAGYSAPQLDLTTIVRASQALSGEIEHPKLIERLMSITMQNAGADRGLLIFTKDSEYRVDVEALMHDDAVVLRYREALNPALPETIVRYAMRTQENVILADARTPNVFSADPYLGAARPRSLLCLPLVRQGTLSGALYLENSLTAHAFAPARTTLLELLASQAAISLENTRLYSDLRAREAKFRRFVEADVIGIAMFSLGGWVVDANDAFLRMLGYDRKDLLARRMNWREMTPPEWHTSDEERIAELRATGKVTSYEKEFFHKQGHRISVLVGAAYFEWEEDEGVSFILDLTDRKRAEQTIRESERRYREIEVSLAHANRIATLGQMTASIAHEINQPLAATVTNAQAALRFLDGSEANLPEVRQALNRIARLGDRAIDVVSRIRALVKKSPPRQNEFELNDAILEVIALTRGEIVKSGVSVETGLSHLPRVYGDCVQVQQVILNLLMNAVEAMSRIHEGSRQLRISTFESGADETVVTVHDSGPGIDPTYIERLFEPFHSTKPTGLGIGLSICRSIIEAHGGRIWVATSDLGGAAFAFSLPVRRG